MTDDLLIKEIQLAICALSYAKSENGSQRQGWVHIDDIRKHVEAGNPNRWRAETITRMTRQLATDGLIRRKMNGIYGI